MTRNLLCVLKCLQCLLCVRGWCRPSVICLCGMLKVLDVICSNLPSWCAVALVGTLPGVWHLRMRSYAVGVALVGVFLGMLRQMLTVVVHLGRLVLQVC